MASQYHSLFTTQGLELLREAIQNGTKLGITHMSYGDGNGSLPIPDASFTKMINEVYRTPLNRLAPSKENPNWLEADGIVPSAVGGFNIREVGLWAGNVMVAYANYPPTYKPSADQGTAQIKTIRIVLQIDNTAVFELKIDASVVMATKQDIEELKQQLEETISITNFGAKPFKKIAEAVACETALNEAIVYAPEGATIYIPAGDFCIDGLVNCQNKNLNFQSDGTLWINANNPLAYLNFISTDGITLNASDILTNLPKKKDNKLKVNSTILNTIKNPSEYFVTLLSKEVEINRAGYPATEAYLKQETFNIIDNLFNLNSPIDLDYTDNSLLKLVFYKKRSMVSKNLNIRLYNLDKTDYKEKIINFFGVSNINLDSLNINVDKPLTGSTIKISNSSDINFSESNLVCNGNLSGDSYPIQVSTASNLNFSKVKHTVSPGGTYKHGYAARHGKNVVFSSCDLSIDDHYGHNYSVFDQILKSSISFAGGSIYLSNVHAPTSYLLLLRSDSPYADGTLTYDKCSSGTGFLYSGRDGNPDTGVITKRKLWDSIQILDCDYYASKYQMIDINYWFIKDQNYTTDLLKIKNLTLHLNAENGFYPGLYRSAFENTFLNHFNLTQLEDIRLVEMSNVPTSNYNYILNLRTKRLEVKDCKNFDHRELYCDEAVYENTKFGIPGRFAKSILTHNPYTASLNKVSVTYKYCLLTSRSSFNAPTTILKDFKFIGCHFESDFMQNEDDKKAITLMRDNTYDKALSNFSMYYNMRGYVSNLVNGERVSSYSFADNLVLELGQATAVLTSTMKNIKLSIPESISYGFDSNSLGLKVNVWVSSDNTVSFYIENPQNNPNGKVTLTKPTVSFRAI